MSSVIIRDLVESGRLTIDVPTAASILGLGRTRGFELARSGELPGIRRLGRRWIVALPELLAYLGWNEGVNANGNGSHPTGTDGAGNE